MINHVRTLLLNSRSENSQLVGEEYVPPEFKPVVISPPIAKVRTALFDPKSDRASVNYRLWQLMTLLHITELENFVLALDRRITYWPKPDVDFGAIIDLPSLPEVVSLLERMLSPADYDVLFGREDAEPYLTFRNLWKDHDQLAYKLGGLVLAVAYRMNESGGF